MSRYEALLRQTLAEVDEASSLVERPPGARVTCSYIAEHDEYVFLLDGYQVERVRGDTLVDLLEGGDTPCDDTPCDEVLYAIHDALKAWYAAKEA